MKIEPELEEVYNAWRQDWSNPAQNQALLRKIQPWVDHSLMAAGGSTSDAALRAKANMMAIAYMRKYDPNKSNIKNYLYGQMRGLNRVIGNDQNIIKIPERIVLQRKAISEAEKELTDELGRFPSMSEIADRTGISMKQITKLQSAGVPMVESVINNTPDTNNFITSRIVGDYNADNAWQEYVYDSLPDRQRSIMERLYGMHGFKPQKPAEISKQLKISQAAISQHRKQIDKLLNDDSRYQLFGD